MTLEEHADNICNWTHNAGLRNAVLEEIADAVQEEREACAEIVEENRFKEPGEVADIIRARFTASDRSVEPTEK